ncbi:myc-induced nuclear antigen [Nannochloropsis gaditana]|uniref:Bifunctional lysine-specific demethylase and histidyl-hydroxylase n=1 Tax=Nannochloropsis gaditana TaxID=72520 RepID=W7TSI8_9STRA|nr:myc-induced nuclear antigen [Nannochloropsis gaditana]
MRARRWWRVSCCALFLHVACSKAFLRPCPAVFNPPHSKHQDPQVPRLPGHCPLTTLPAATTANAPISTAPVVADQALGTLLVEADTGCDKLDLKRVFEALTAPSSPFLAKYWQRAPCFTSTSIPCLAQAWTMADMEEAIAKEFLLAGRGFFEENSETGGWKMAAVGLARGSSFEEAKLRPEDVRAALKQRSGTVVFNSVGGSVAALAGVCLDAVEAFRLPVALNLYMTAPGQSTSAPPHTDKQDVFVLQTQGRKRWRVLYMPAGFPHTTDTVVGMAEERDPSVHLTLGVDTHIWGLTHAALRDYFLYRLQPGPTATLPPPPPSTQTLPEAFVRFHAQLPLGLREAAAADAGTRWSALKQVLGAGVEAEFQAVMREIEDEHVLQRLEEEGAAEVLGEVVARLLDHHRSLTSVFRAMYSDVKYGLSDVTRDLSCLRSQPYYQNLETTMQALVDWAAPAPAGGRERERKMPGGQRRAKAASGGPRSSVHS